MEKSGNRRTFILMSILVFAFLLIPVWQRNVSFELQNKIQESELYIGRLSEEKMHLEAQIANQSTAEYLLAQANVRNIDFTKYANTTTTSVASL